jgi:hypothetical protein
MAIPSNSSLKLIKTVESIASAHAFDSQMTVNPKHKKMFDTHGGFEKWLQTIPNMRSVYTQTLELAKRAGSPNALKKIIENERNEAARMRHLSACIEAASIGMFDSRRPFCLSRISAEIRRLGGNGEWIRSSPVLLKIFREKFGPLTEGLLSKRAAREFIARTASTPSNKKKHHGGQLNKAKYLHQREPTLSNRGASEASSVGMTEGTPWCQPAPYTGPSQIAEPPKESPPTPIKIDWNRADENGF